MPASAHPYMANSTPQAVRTLLDAVGASDVEELFEQIPADHRLQRLPDLGSALRSELDLQRHVLDLLRRNATCADNLSFLGGGCYQHHVPAVVDEVVGRTELLTPVWGTPSSDHGSNQAWFEFQSQLGELLDLDFVGLPVYSYGCAAGHAIRMATRLTGRTEVLVPCSLDPERLAVIRTYCAPPDMPRHITVVPVDEDPTTGRLDVADVRRKVSERTAAVYFENPSYLGVIETAGAEIAGRARAVGAETIVGVDPISLGVLEPPPRYGADIVVGNLQPLGIHMNAGGGTGGFIASRDEERYAREYPTLVLSIAETVEPGERGFGVVLFDQTSYGARDAGNDWTGTSVYLWAIAAAAYLALLGPSGLVELGELIVQRAHYAARRIAAIPGITIRFPAGFFQEFVVDLNATGRTVAEVDARLRERGIFGGRELSHAFPHLGQCALYCISEVHSQADIERLTAALEEVTR